jgi:hypothetical protein
MGSTYTCEACHGTFSKGWSDDEALAEAVGLFGAIPVEEQAVVCDDCFNAMRTAGLF